MSPETVLMWSAAVILAALAIATLVGLAFVLYEAVRRIDDMRQQARQRELTVDQVKEVRAFARQLANENYKKRMARVRAEDDADR